VGALQARLLLPCVAIAASLALAPAAGAHHVVEGELEGVHADYFDRDTSTTHWQLETADGTVGVLPTTVPALSQNDNEVALTDEDPGSGVAGPVKSVGPVASPALGAHKLAVIAVNFLTDTRQPWTTDQIRAAIFGPGASANTFFKEETYNQLSLTGKVRADGDVYGWYTLPVAPTSCDYSTWATLAKSAAQAGGFNASGYQHIMYVFPEQDACGWAGLAYMPGSESWINGDLSVRVTAHELGHNLGLNHAGSWFCTGASGQSVTISSNCALSEYNDPYDVMGALGSRHSNGWHLEQLGVLQPSNVQTVTASGTYTLTAALDPTVDPTTIRIPRTYAADNSVQDWYYVEIRKAGGVFDNFPSTDWAVKGVSIRVADNPTQLTRSRLLDNHPGGSIYDAPLQPGETFSDGHVSVTTVSAGAGSASVSVNMSAPPLDQQAPSTPTGLSHVLLSSGLRLSWNPSGDNVGVRSYTIDRDGYAIGTTSARSYDDTTVTAGRHVYTVYAQDAARNQSPASAPYVVDVPAQGVVQRRTTTSVDRKAPRLRLYRKRLRHRVMLLTARASDGSGIARLEIRIDGHRVRAGRKGKLRYRWHLRRGRHRVVVVAYDKRGNRAKYTLKYRVR
jgi:Gametolysin peptidase M11